MKLQDLVSEYVQSRQPGWLVLDEPEVAAYALEAARYFAAYGDIAALSKHDPLPGATGADDPVPTMPSPMPSLTNGVPIKNLALIGLATDITTGEWAVIGGLFALLVELENAMRLEASRSAGLDPYGRSVSEIQQALDMMRNETIPRRAFVALPVTV